MLKCWRNLVNLPVLLYWTWSELPSVLYYESFPCHCAIGVINKELLMSNTPFSLHPTCWPRFLREQNLSVMMLHH